MIFLSLNLNVSLVQRDVRARAEEKARIGNYKESKKAGEEARKKQEEEDKEDAKPRVLFLPFDAHCVVSFEAPCAATPVGFKGDFD